MDAQLTAADDDTTEACCAKVWFGKVVLTVCNVYVPPICPGPADLHTQQFDPQVLPSNENLVVAGDFKSHHPSWDDECEIADMLGEAVDAWISTTPMELLNDGRPMQTDFGSVKGTALDLAMRSSLAQPGCLDFLEASSTHG